MIAKIFNDYFAVKENMLSKIDSRIKLLFVILAIILTICSNSFLLPLAVAFLSLSSLIMVRIPPSILLFRLITPLGMAIVIFIVQVFFYGQSPLFELNIAGLHLIGFKEGLHQGILIMSKVVGAVSLVLFLFLTTSLSKLLFAAYWFKIPQAFIEVIMLTYRYIFVLLESALEIRNAQRLRLGYINFRTGLQSWGDLTGAMVIKAYQQAIQTHEAMIARGYSGKMAMEREEKLKPRDILAIFAALAALILMYLFNFCRT